MVLAGGNQATVGLHIPLQMEGEQGQFVLSDDSAESGSNPPGQARSAGM